MQLRSLYLLVLLTVLIIIFIVSGIHPTKRIIWLYEVSPSILLLIFLLKTYNSLPLTSFSYVIIFIGITLTFIGGHYTYGGVSIFDNIKHMFDLSRNHFDRLGHLFLGMVIMAISREWALRNHWIPNKRWINLSCFLLTLALSSGYEIFEFLAGLLSGTNVEEFLGTQGDPWDSHWDIISALLGAIFVWMLSRWQDRQITLLEERFTS